MTWIFSVRYIKIVANGRISDGNLARVMHKPWSDDGGFICQNFHAVGTGFGCCLQCLTPVQYRYIVRKDYLSVRASPPAAGPLSRRTGHGRAKS
eukprot:3738431-Pyramimonas_sp.AAC.1